MEKLGIGLVTLFIGGVFFLAYNNPKGYKALTQQIGGWILGSWWWMILFFAGCHFTLWQLDYEYTEGSVLVHFIGNFGYVWGIGLFWGITYGILLFIGHTLSEVKAKGSAE